MKSLRSRSVGALMVVVVLTATLLATLVVGASASTRKSNHVTRINHAQRTTAHLMKPRNGGTVPVTG